MEQSTGAGGERTLLKVKVTWGRGGGEEYYGQERVKGDSTRRGWKVTSGERHSMKGSPAESFDSSLN